MRKSLQYFEPNKKILTSDNLGFHVLPSRAMFIKLDGNESTSSLLRFKNPQNLWVTDPISLTQIYLYVLLAPALLVIKECLKP